ncbi:helix-turn-helix domain-containing protein [Flagellimonas onchidii]|uniref:helix-turn-helix domain-containing protein n=1 Tax=Flagellimonas onchidii TaxID=2562684 RepID=UPI0010A69545|nr:AraC family transcriptional regulator [Allomuricauda onchidii]
MLIARQISESGDPSTDHQIFRKLKFQVLCCRYWWFEAWKGKKMSFPYWRLYWNKNPGAYVYYNEKIYLTPENIYLIPPYTPFSNNIDASKADEKTDYFFKCGKINSKEEENHHEQIGNIIHFFIHFTLGHPFDNVTPGVYPLLMTEQEKNQLSTITQGLINDSANFSIKQSLTIYSLVLSIVNKLPLSVWSKKRTDEKIRTIIDYIENNLDSKLTNEILSKKIMLSPSSFLRLFHKNTGQSPSSFIKQMRLEKANNLLLDTNMSIDYIAFTCGFSDRYHFTKVFCRVMKISPAAYRKTVGLL